MISKEMEIKIPSGLDPSTIALLQASMTAVYMWR